MYTGRLRIRPQPLLYAQKKSVHLKRYTLCLVLWKLACDSSFERIYAVSLFPRHVQIGAAHVTVSGELTVNRTAQIQIADDCGRTQIEYLLNGIS